MEESVRNIVKIVARTGCVELGRQSVHADRALEHGHDDVILRVRGGSYLEAAKEVRRDGYHQQQVVCELLAAIFNSFTLRDMEMKDNLIPVYSCVVNWVV